ncbi:hypothetical protein D3C81_1642860 [compost metagenome]
MIDKVNCNRYVTALPYISYIPFKVLMNKFHFIFNALIKFRLKYFKLLENIFCHIKVADKIFFRVSFIKHVMSILCMWVWIHITNHVITLVSFGFVSNIISVTYNILMFLSKTKVSLCLWNHTKLFDVHVLFNL